MNIEDKFIPDTLNELLLYRRILELKRGMYKKGVMDFKPMDTGEIDVNVLSPTLVLSMLNVVDVDRDDKFGVKVTARSYGEDSFGFATYVSDMELYQLNDKMDMIANLYKNALYDLAKMYEKKEPEDE